MLDYFECGMYKWYYILKYNYMCKVKCKLTYACIQNEYTQIIKR
jgi:hypothetical protein